MLRVLLLASILSSSVALAEDCAAFVPAASERWRLPPGLLAAVVRAESGGRMYALNVDGAAVYPQSAAEAERIVMAARQSDAKNVDVGCGQISLRHHPQFALSLSLDARENVNYAASYLSELHRIHGDWTAAVAHYHSADPTRQSVYLQLVGWTAGAAVTASANVTETARPDSRGRLIRVGSLYVRVRP